MTELVRVLRGLRRLTDDPREMFVHRLRIGLMVAALILILSFLE
ncbi:hypothetical protein [Roseovarius sp. E0-M6]